MKYDDRILGLFFSNEDNLIYDNIKFSENLTDDKKNQLNMLSYRFLGPVFLTAAISNGDKWNITLIESSLSHYQGQVSDVIQSFFSLNSSITSEDGITNLFALIGSPYTEDLNELYNILTKYIHPSIIQGKIVNEDLLGNRFNFHKFIRSEMIRGLHLINYSLGASRKVYWKMQHNYSCVGLIERIISHENKKFCLYTYDENDPLRKETLKFIPSYYVMCILPDYYENLIDETLHIFNKASLFANIRLINLSNHDKKVIYLEEFKVEKNIKKRYGVILVQDCKSLGNPKKISYYKKNLRLILDGNKELNQNLELFNPKFTNKKWITQSEEDLNRIKALLDNFDN
ncbi:MAG: hypothetical protein EU532_11870 [Promethearchaeota archaeon]|nr:MAG: hypothetical protein EU532_11870 [Candidatus Lokiarchaeota archaeon]